MPSILDGIILDGNKIAIVTLLLGANDAAIDNPVSINRYIENLNYMLGLIKTKSPSTKVVLMTPPPVGITRKFPDRDANHTRLYRDAVLEVGKNALTCDVWGKSLVTLDLWDSKMTLSADDFIFIPLSGL